MDDLIVLRRIGSPGESEAKSNIEKYAELLRSEDSKISTAIEELKQKAASIEKQL